jgi:acetyl-CoA synthetase
MRNGYFSFFGRDDDVITSSGYRIGPGEIENCLTGHPAVALAAAVGKPDPVRTEIVKAYVVVKPGIKIDEALTESVRDWVKTRLSAHEYPREIEFVDDLPLTTTGKVIRRVLRRQGHRSERAERLAQARPLIGTRPAMPRIFSRSSRAILRVLR